MIQGVHCSDLCHSAGCEVTGYTVVCVVEQAKRRYRTYTAMICVTVQVVR